MVPVIILLWTLLLILHMVSSKYSAPFVNNGKERIRRNLIESDHKKRVILLHVSDGNFQTKDIWKGTDGAPSLVELSQVSALSYARIHGYTYRRLVYDKNQSVGEVSGTSWVKIYGLLDAMQADKFQHEWIVVMDLDVVFMDYTSSLEEKIREWSGDNNPQILWPDDPAKNPSNWVTLDNGTRILNGNSGFQIWRNTPDNLKIARRLFDCRKTFCSEFDTVPWLDQSAFNKFIRFNLSAGIYQPIPCDQANGFPDYFENDWVGWDQRNEGCFGRFLSHFWCESKNRLSSRRKIYQLMNDAIFSAQIKLLNSHIYRSGNGAVLNLSNP